MVWDVEGDLAGDFCEFDFIAVEGEDVLEIASGFFQLSDEVEGLDEGVVIDIQDVIVQQEARVALWRQRRGEQGEVVKEDLGFIDTFTAVVLDAEEDVDGAVVADAIGGDDLKGSFRRGHDALVKGNDAVFDCFLDGPVLFHQQAHFAQLGFQLELEIGLFPELAFMHLILGEKQVVAFALLAGGGEAVAQFAEDLAVDDLLGECAMSIAEAADLLLDLAVLGLEYAELFLDEGLLELFDLGLKRHGLFERLTDKVAQPGADAIVNDLHFGGVHALALGDDADLLNLPGETLTLSTELEQFGLDGNELRLDGFEGRIGLELGKGGFDGFHLLALLIELGGDIGDFPRAVLGEDFFELIDGSGEGFHFPLQHFITMDGIVTDAHQIKMGLECWQGTFLCAHGIERVAKAGGLIAHQQAEKLAEAGLRGEGITGEELVAQVAGGFLQTGEGAAACIRAVDERDLLRRSDFSADLVFFPVEGEIEYDGEIVRQHSGRDEADAGVLKIPAEGKVEKIDEHGFPDTVDFFRLLAHGGAFAQNQIHAIAEDDGGECRRLAGQLMKTETHLGR